MRSRPTSLGQPPGDSVVDFQRSLGDDVAVAAEDDVGVRAPDPMVGDRFAVRGGDPALVAAFQNQVGGDQRPIFEDLHLVRQGVDLHHPSARGVRHAVEVAADADHAVAGYPPLKAQHGPERRQRQRPQVRPLLGEGLVHHPLRRGVHAWIGDRL